MAKKNLVSNKVAERLSNVIRKINAVSKDLGESAVHSTTLQDMLFLSECTRELREIREG